MKDTEASRVMVRAKVQCQSVTQRRDYRGSDYGHLWSYEFSFVTQNSPENKEFWQYTPSGTLKLDSIKSDLFSIGQEYYLDFTAA